MRIRKTSCVIILALSMSACSAPQGGEVAPRVTATTNQTAIQVQTIADNLYAPWSVAILPDASFLVTEHGGQLLHITKDGSRTEITGLPDDIYVEKHAGLLDVVLAPDFPESKTVYLSYATGTRKSNHTVILRARLVDAKLVDSEIVFATNPAINTSSHYGGRMVFLPDGTLIMSVGDGLAYREAAQDKASDLGKIVRINGDGTIPTDNPFIGVDGVRPEIYSLGHRNPQGLHFDSVSGTLWSHEHGPKGGDELNIIKSGNNYGWPIATTGVDYNGAKITPFKTYAGMENFVKDWVPSIAPSGLTIYRGDMFPEWDGDALVGGLKSRDLRRVILEDGKFVREYILLEDLNARIRDVRTAPDGSILILTDDDTEGKFLRLTPK